MSIVNECMVVNLRVSTWTGHKLDKVATDKLTADAGADYDAARVNKHLVSKTELQPITRAASAVRYHFYQKTLPWKDNGDRLLTRRMYHDFMAEHASLVSALEKEVDHFIEKVYPQVIARAQFRMGAMFDSADYPQDYEIARKFGVGLDIDAVSTAGDFRVDMEEKEVARVRQTMEAALQDRMGRAMTDVWTRIGDVLESFADKMQAGGRFRKSTIENIDNLVADLPNLIPIDDAQVEAIRREMKSKLTGIDPDDLRKDAALRTEKAKDAREIIDKMGSFMGAMQKAAA